MKRIIYSFFLLIGLSATSFATSGPFGPPAKGEASLTAEEIELVAELEKELAIDIEQVLADLKKGQEVTEVKVFDLEGNEVSTFEGDNALKSVPAAAELLMTDGGTQYFVVAD